MNRYMLALAVAIVAAFTASGQINAVQPPNPTSVDVIVLDVTTPYPDMPLRSIVRNGSEIRLTFRNIYSIFPSAGRYRVPLGRLPAGTYSVILVFETGTEDEVFHSVTRPPYTLTVTEGYFVPAVSSLGRLGLAITLAIAALVVLRRF